MDAPYIYQVCIPSHPVVIITTRVKDNNHIGDAIPPSNPLPTGLSRFKSNHGACRIEGRYHLL